MYTKNTQSNKTKKGRKEVGKKVKRSPEDLETGVIEK